jgi:hypothetical protein
MEIILRFIDLCLFRASPSDLPASYNVLKITLLSYFVLAVIVNQLDTTWNISFIISLADVLLMVIIAYLLLNYRGLQSRYTQTVTALAGAGCCMLIVGFPILWWFFQIDSEQQEVSFAMLLMVALLLWSLMITAQIFRQSLEIKAGTATLITLAYVTVSIMITGLIMSGAA